MEEGIIEVAKRKLALDGQIIQAGKFDGHTTAEERESFLVSVELTPVAIAHAKSSRLNILSDRCWSGRMKRMKRMPSLMKILSTTSWPEGMKNVSSLLKWTRSARLQKELLVPCPA